MKIRIKVILGGLVGVLSVFGPLWGLEQLPAFAPGDRVMVLAPHPDDDILGCAGVIQTAVAQHLPVRVVYLTNGDNYEWAFMAYKKHPVLSPQGMQAMGRLRRKEAIAAEQILGVPETALSFLGYPDWGTEHIFMEHWGPDRVAYRSMLTRVTEVPYAEAYHPGAPYKGEDILKDLESIMREFKPTKVFVVHPADIHRDHRTTFLFGQVALWDLSDKVHANLYTYIVHFPHWPEPRGILEGRKLVPPKVLDDAQWKVILLTENNVKAKQSALECHRTQMALDRKYLDSFVAVNELFSQVNEIHPGVHIEMPAHPLPETEGIEASTMTVSEVSWKYFSREGDDLILRMEFSKRSAMDHPVRLYAFGYRKDRPFAEMPKIQIRIHGQHVRLFDQGKPLEPSGIQIDRNGRSLVLRLPLSLLGDPEKIIGTAYSRSAEEPFDQRIWRVLNLQNGKGT